MFKPGDRIVMNTDYSNHKQYGIYFPPKNTCGTIENINNNHYCWVTWDSGTDPGSWCCATSDIVAYMPDIIAIRIYNHQYHTMADIIDAEDIITTIEWNKDQCAQIIPHITEDTIFYDERHKKPFKKWLKK